MNSNHHFKKMYLLEHRNKTLSWYFFRIFLFKKLPHSRYDIYQLSQRKVFLMLLYLVILTWILFVLVVCWFCYITISGRFFFDKIELFLKLSPYFFAGALKCYKISFNCKIRQIRCVPNCSFYFTFFNVESIFVFFFCEIRFKVT